MSVVRLQLRAGVILTVAAREVALTAKPTAAAP
jgi:hypothetical protein